MYNNLNLQSKISNPNEDTTSSDNNSNQFSPLVIKEFIKQCMNIPEHSTCTRHPLIPNVVGKCNLQQRHYLQSTRTSFRNQTIYFITLKVYYMC